MTSSTIYAALSVMLTVFASAPVEARVPGPCSLVEEVCRCEEVCDCAWHVRDCLPGCRSRPWHAGCAEPF